VASTGFLAGCATAVPPELVNARDAYRRASTGSAAQVAPAELHVANEALMWNDPVNSTDTSRLGGASPAFPGADQTAVEVAFATVDQSDVRGSKPHGPDPSGAISF
jgi:hypothetical protein